MNEIFTVEVVVEGIKTDLSKMFSLLISAKGKSLSMRQSFARILTKKQGKRIKAVMSVFRA